MKAREDSALMRAVLEKVAHRHPANSQDVIAVIEGWQKADIAGMLTRLLTARYLSEDREETPPTLALTEQGRALLKRLIPNPKPRAPERPLVTAPFVCVPCRASFKHYTHGTFLAVELPCPHCGRPALRVSTNFKPPRKSEDKQWQKVGMLLEAGSRFEDVGESYPAKLADTAAFIERHRSKWGGFWAVHDRNA